MFSNLAGTINATTPLWTAVIAYTAGIDRRRSPRRIVGLALGFTGALLLLSPWDVAGSASMFGALACLGAAVSYGLSYVYQSRYITNRGHAPLVLAFGQLCAAAALLALALPIAGETAPRLGGAVLPAVLILGTLGTGAAYVINYALITNEGPTVASVVTYLVPVVAVALGIVFLSEPSSPGLLTGASLILLGVGLVQRQRLGPQDHGASSNASASR